MTEERKDVHRTSVSLRKKLHDLILRRAEKSGLNTTAIIERALETYFKLTMVKKGCTVVVRDKDGTETDVIVI